MEGSEHRRCLLFQNFHHYSNFYCSIDEASKHLAKDKRTSFYRQREKTVSEEQKNIKPIINTKQSFFALNWLLFKMEHLAQMIDRLTFPDLSGAQND